MSTAPQSTTTTSVPPPTLATIPPPTTTEPTSPSESLPINPNVRTPDGTGPFPVAVLVHGGGWVAGAPGAMAPLARLLTAEGYLTINTNYQLADGQPGFPDAIRDVACAVRLGQTHPDGDGTVVLIGHSAGAHISAVVALTGDEYRDGCPVDGTGIPERLVGLSGPYDVDRLGILMYPFFGGGPNAEPEAWVAGNPLNHTTANTDLQTLLLHGDRDGLVEIDFSFQFAGALTEAGSEALVEVVEGASHFDTLDPDVVGSLLLAWLDR